MQAVYVRATGAGTGGIAAFVLDGWGLAAKLQPLWQSKREIRLSQRGDLCQGKLLDRGGKALDEAVLAFLSSNETSTGFEQIELCCHGGIGIAAAVEAELEHAGFERAAGRELLFRAHLNHKLPLTAVEARLLLPRAATSRQAEFLLGHETFRKKWERIGFDAAMGMRSGDSAWREQARAAARDACERAPGALALLRRHAVVLAGNVNAGKSTLANRLARAERHIVSALPGTTRDRLETPLNLRGLELALSDTAGLRESDDSVEREGQRRARAALESADLRVIVLDASKPPENSELDLIKTCNALGPSLTVLNKADLGLHEAAQGLGFLAGTEPLPISARDGTGIEPLEQAIESALLGGIVPLAGDAFSARQIALLQEICDDIEHGFEDTMSIRCIVKLCATRGNAEQLAQVVDDWKLHKF